MAKEGAGGGVSGQARVLQFGTGVLLRGFFDWMLQRSKDIEKWEGTVVGVKLTPHQGSFPLAEQPSHSHTTRGFADGKPLEEHSTISVVERWLNPYTAQDLREFLESARLPSLDVVVSNSTEAGLAYKKTPKPDPGVCPESFPAKLLLWLHARFQADPKLRATVLPLELLEDNGNKLQEIVLHHAEDWALGEGFSQWLRENCDFRNTLVDRIVTKPGEGDHPLMTVSEPYHLLAIEGNDSLESRLPLRAAGLNVIYTNELSRYRSRKVRVLNGAHHTITFLGLLMGKGNVLECVDDPALGRFLKHVISREVLPILEGDSKELEEYAATIVERFRNPWLNHRLEAIAMNSAAKVQVRLIPSIADNLRMHGTLPEGLVLAVAAYLRCELPIKGCEKQPVEEACRAIAGLEDAVKAAVTKLRDSGPEVALSRVLNCTAAEGVEAKRPRLAAAIPPRMRQCLLQEPGKFVFTEVDTPDDPPPGWAIVRTGAVGMCGTDFHAFHGRQNFFTYPRVLGHEIGATIVALGKGTSDSGLKVGDRCAVVPYWGCGSCLACPLGKTNCCANISVIGVHAHGAMQEYIAVPVDKLAPSNELSLDQLALVETLCIGAHAVFRGQPRANENVLVIGSGPIGMGTAQFAKAEGANVAVMDISASRLEFIRKAVGIQNTINSADSQDTVELVKGAFKGELPTLVFDATGNLGSMQKAFTFAGHGGKLVFVGHTKEKVSFENPLFHARELTICASRNAVTEDFKRVIGLIERNEVDVTPWITHRCSYDNFEENFMHWMTPDSGVIKGIVQLA